MMQMIWEISASCQLHSQSSILSPSPAAAPHSCYRRNGRVASICFLLSRIKVALSGVASFFPNICPVERLLLLLLAACCLRAERRAWGVLFARCGETGSIPPPVFLPFCLIRSTRMLLLRSPPPPLPPLPPPPPPPPPPPRLLSVSPRWRGALFVRPPRPSLWNN